MGAFLLYPPKNPPVWQVLGIVSCGVEWRLAFAITQQSPLIVSGDVAPQLRDFAG